ncbi:hypothetical protein D9758_003419 [Tetrapyrgos nigripes]|uniref:GH16 domain-containing protein n=1 Tax=Tetrapyrgos nigripes TaxID=182062 RepID=A0A8H5GVG0_9AGAR|nr:hypothetical protein D9758_003419 [Tetrapyrgos nigripes]
MSSLGRDPRFGVGPAAPGSRTNNLYSQPATSPSSASLISNSSYNSNSTYSPNPSRSNSGSRSVNGRAPPYSNPFSRGPGSIRSVASSASTAHTAQANGMNDSPYSVTTRNGRQIGSMTSISDKYSLSADPRSWGTNLSMNDPEADDFLHNPDPKRDSKNDRGGSYFNDRSFSNLGCLLLLAVALIGLFAGYPIISYLTRHSQTTFGGFNVGGLNASGQVPELTGSWGLVDPDTPDDARTFTSFATGEDLVLVFSDEFEKDGRSFYPGDDPYWEAVDLHYWQTNNLEWYDPSAITTKNGSLEVTLSQVTNPAENHDLNYKGGMMSTWNKFCFTGGLIQSAVTLPGINNVAGLWPAVWTMGNLGRAGYGASLEGMWPYSYDECDLGTLKNQTLNGGPPAALNTGTDDGSLSFLPGQRLSRCTCAGESHPGPMHQDGTFVGRSAPEIDIFEAQVVGREGHVSQSGQWAPFDASYVWTNTSDTFTIYDDTLTVQNSYLGGVFQQATSALTTTDQECYELNSGCFSVYGFEYKPGYDDAYITWISDAKAAWTLQAAGVGANDLSKISHRQVPPEPLYIIINLGISPNFGDIDFEHLTFPTKMRVDWVRVYQPANAINIGCDPKDFPTKAYIDAYSEAYTNYNLTLWSATAAEGGFEQPVPKNKLIDQC